MGFEPMSAPTKGILWHRGGGAIRPLSRNGSVEELHGDPTVGPRPRSGPEVKNESNAKDGTSERLSCGTIQE